MFIFRRIEESTNADADRIYQFDVSTDVMDLRVIDARDHTVANNAFRWSEDGRAAWSVWAVDTRYGSRVMADTNGDGRADMSIKMIGVAGLTAAAAFGTAGFHVTIVDPTPPITTRDADGSDLRTTAFLQPAQAFLETAGLWDRLAPHATPLQVGSELQGSWKSCVSG